MKDSIREINEIPELTMGLDLGYGEGYLTRRRASITSS